jgi:hypothetical protein
MIVVQYPIVDLLVAALWIGHVVYLWRGIASQTEKDVAERELGAMVIGSQLNGVVTGSSIIIAGIGAFAALSDELVPPYNWHAAYAAMWAVLSLGAALYTMGTLPTRTKTENFVQSRGVAIACTIALFFCLAAGVRFFLAVWVQLT